MLGSYLRTEGEKIRNVYPKYDPVYKLILTILILLLLKKNLYQHEIEAAKQKKMDPVPTRIKT